ncbi:hypothetical protein K493DRAFT_292355 [Basidiobolus meristosporus CBS 931.73]|uniref:FIST domain-containing protein n=1 Tax=Basidiobolus meristosporus CBS 931.73 TaxID=1314790 RepID=A0A1Y1XAM2_9FUNG|nr:hypothetical protein K493DRAFT_292355 [Basidiobolus meristosporus CBS 931.73]|eukprot:ORX82404.1 hypothetical protein K493DRAFT_292355 [Basidiobolus meristosporus CBS 931.73]
MLLLHRARVSKPCFQALSTRRLWASATSSEVSLSNSLNSCLTQLFPEKSAAEKPKCDLCLVFATQSFDSSELESIPLELKSRVDSKVTLGCVVDKVLTKEGFVNGVGIVVGSFENARLHPFYDDNNKRKVMKEKSVGRWKRPSEIKKESMETFDWTKFTSISSATNSFALPEGLEEAKKTDSSLILLATDKEPDQLLETLDHHFPTSSKFGLIGSSTPFSTGRPTTLYLNDKVFSGGAVGVVISDSTKEIQKPALSLQFPSLRSLGSPMKITRCRGNVILELDEANATQLLLSSLQADQSYMISKEVDMYLKIFSTEDIESSGPAVIHKITSGDPSKGTMSIDTIADLKVGQYVQFLCEKNQEPAFPDDDTPDIETFPLSLGTSSIEHMGAEIPHKSKNVPFSFYSENGFHLSTPNGESGKGITWTCTAPWSNGRLSLK